MRKLGIDYGDTRVGIAITDELGITAQGLLVKMFTLYPRDAHLSTIQKHQILPIGGQMFCSLHTMFIFGQWPVYKPPAPGLR